MKSKVLVTGGAGYIGSHTVKLLGESGFYPITIDNLSQGKKEFVLYGKFIKADLCNLKMLNHVFKNYKVESVIHFAANTIVEESTKDPIKYYKNNVLNTLNLLEVMIKNDVKKFIFSSSAAVYGKPSKIPIEESAPLLPINPYGKTKLIIEKILEDFEKSYGLKYISLRYFNAAGADPSRKIGEIHNPETHLIPNVLKVAFGKSKAIKIFGCDYPTYDGTCIRDYIHVNDLAEAHLLALKYLHDGGKSDVSNLGCERGYSVREVIKCAEETTGKKIREEVCKRREGDPPILIASHKKIKKLLNWQPKYDDLEYIVSTAWNFIKNNWNLRGNWKERIK